jgi:hypothetical protein
MKKLIGVLAGLAVMGLGVAVLAAGAATAPAAAKPMAKDMSITGEVVDTGCYLGHEGKGPGHKECAEKCLKMGMPASLLTGEGKLYLLLPDHDDQAPFEQAKTAVAQTVTVSGPMSEKGGMNAITVKQVKVAAAK